MQRTLYVFLMQNKQNLNTEIDKDELKFVCIFNGNFNSTLYQSIITFSSWVH